MKKKTSYRRLLLAVTALIVAICALSLSACLQKPANALDGTKWKATYMLDGDGAVYTGDTVYEIEFTSELATFNPRPELYGYIRGLGDSYHYQLENGNLTLSIAIGTAPTVVSYSEKVIEIRTNSNEFFHYEKVN